MASDLDQLRKRWEGPGERGCCYIGSILTRRASNFSSPGACVITLPATLKGSLEAAQNECTQRNYNSRRSDANHAAAERGRWALRCEATRGVR